MKVFNKLFIVILLFISVNVLAEVSFTEQVNCSFNYYQFMDDDSHKSKEHKKPLDWSFGNLTTTPSYISGGDSGKVLLHQHQMGGGISFFLPEGNGAHLFSIWPNGVAYWSKHNVIGTPATQQFRGTCSN